MSGRKQVEGRLVRLRALLESGVGHVLVRLTVGALLFLIAGIVMRQARAYTYRMDGFRVDADSLVFVGLPEWGDARVAQAFEPWRLGAFSVSIYDPEAPELLRAHVLRHPMVGDVRQLRLLYPNRAEVEPVLRVPVARVAVWVQGREGHQVLRSRLLSDDGCLLPRGPYAAYLEGLPHELPHVTGISEQAPLDPGETWEDGSGRVQEAVAGAALAARLFRDLWGRVTVTRIDVARFPAAPEAREAGEVRLVLSCPPASPDGPRVERTVEWGRTDRARADVPWEDDYATKLRRLRVALTAARPPLHVDVRWEAAGALRHIP